MMNVENGHDMNKIAGNMSRWELPEECDTIWLLKRYVCQVSHAKVLSACVCRGRQLNGLAQSGWIFYTDLLSVDAQRTHWQM